MNGKRFALHRITAFLVQIAPNDDEAAIHLCIVVVVIVFALNEICNLYTFKLQCESYLFFGFIRPSERFHIDFAVAKQTLSK